MMMRFLEDEGGATAIEYSIVATIISLAIIGGMNLLADQVEMFFQSMDTSVADAIQQ